ncbi:MAG TPA: NAD(P)-dependent oxidoreductase [Aliidongia sp.]|uniref:NAD(P)-dependent oxidoreductase n=1 Tax=Aliidongia sp. TaxID=1914230 RepID=UPI002DDDAC35|nr:NAD(P)-dependent oxidoreductase [Aliidongia sp.]HEV2673772.1 NAD(P)-dependent oxidoreductase [Aliidongia sp.]
MRVGFVGLGLMGLPMARHLIAGGHQLFVASSSSQPLEILAAAGATVCATPREIADQVDVFFSCRVTPEQSRETFLGADGAIQAGNRELLCVDLSTIDPETSKAIGQALADRGMGFLDAPISGGPDGAAAKTLSIIVGGASADVDRAQPLFDLLGKKTFHMGPIGAGVAAKLCNNMITITTHALLAEAMVLGVKAGIDAHRLYEVLSASSASSRSLERVVPHHFLKRNFEPAVMMATVVKDLECAVDTGRKLGVRLLLPNVALQCFVEAAGLGHSGDIASVILPMEAIAGVKVGTS